MPETPRNRSLPLVPTDEISTDDRVSSLVNTVNLLVNKVNNLEISISSLSDDLAEANDTISMLNHNVIISNDIKNKKIISLEKKIKKLTEESEIQKIELNTLNQYGRRENIEIVGVKESITQDKLEDYITKLLKEIGVTVTDSDIVAAHRIGKSKRGGNRNVIVHFVNRKHAIEAYKNRRKLKNLRGIFGKIFIIENLCPTHKSIFNRLYKLY